MCSPNCLDFIARSATATEVRGRRVLEVGSLDVNGTCRAMVEALEPGGYVGVDVTPGPGVDVVCDAEHLVDRFGEGSFDVLISTEMLEHVLDWRAVISNLKRVVRPGGVLLITTRSKGFSLHGYPYDFWRYEPDDLRAIFADCDIESMERDAPESPGVFCKVRRRDDEVVSLSGHALHSVIRRRRTSQISAAEARAMAIAFTCWTSAESLLPSPLRAVVRKASHRWEGPR